MVLDQHDESLALDREPFVMGTGASEALLDYCKADFLVQLIEVLPAEVHTAFGVAVARREAGFGLQPVGVQKSTR